ncbi:DUF6493 family protein [Nonomuraea indica]|uniref:DUF7824 domain-containing protein n=1 Tax=Nonomuraea indica TaxID=1581193 RepID=UPI001181CAC3|nr:DUF6493 family protein [Nonomuraea indica]
MSDQRSGTAWDAVRAAIDAEDAAAVAALVAGFGDSERREVARELPGHIAEVRRTGEARDVERREAMQRAWDARVAEYRRRTGDGHSPTDYYWDLWVHHETYVGSRWIEPMRVAGAGTLGGAAAVVSWLHRRDFQRWTEPADLDDVPLILQVIAARPAAWQADLAVRLALRLRAPRRGAGRADRSLRLALEALRRTGTEPPPHDPLTVAWVTSWDAPPPADPAMDQPPGQSEDQPADQSASRTASPIAGQSPPPADPAADPLFEAMLPRLFDAEGVGRLLRDDRSRPAWLARLTRDGQVSRRSLLDGCVSRFLRGGTAADLRFFVRLHDELDPAPEEVALRRRDYLRLLPAAPPNVAELALKRLRGLGPLDPDEAAEAVEGLVFRAEGKLARAGLIWLDRLARDHRGDLDGYAGAMGAALVSESAEVRARAARLAVKHAARFTPVGAEQIRDALPLMPPGEGVALAEVFGGEAAPAEPEPEGPSWTPVPLPSAPEPARVTPPVLGPAGLPTHRLSEHRWLVAERWLDVFVRLAATDRAALTEALAPVAAVFPEERYLWSPWWHQKEWAAAMAKELAEPGAEAKAVAGHPEIPPTAQERVPDSAAPGRLVPLRRFAEVYQALVDGTLPPYLLATPTHANGRLDAAELVDRLEGYERAGVEALPVDLEQALLRLPRAVPPAVAERAAALTGTAGRAVARWMTDPPAEPRVTLRLEERGSDVFVVPEIVAGPIRSAVLDEAFAHRRGDDGADALKALLSIVPGHRELVAAHAVHQVLAGHGYGKPTAALLADLAAAEGPGGPGTALLAAHCLCVEPEETLRPLLWLAASGGLPGAEVGAQLALLFRHDEARNSREYRTYSVAEVLAVLEQAAWCGAHREVWQIMSGLLAGYLPGPGEKATVLHTRMTTFAVQVAAWADARGELPLIAELAARRRESGLVRQARRLHARLTG